MNYELRTIDNSSLTSAEVFAKETEGKPEKMKATILEGKLKEWLKRESIFADILWRYFDTMSYILLVV